MQVLMTDDDKTPVSCPRCGGPLLDVRGSAVSVAALEAEGTCHRWADDKFKCAKTPIDTMCGAPIRDRSGRDLGYACNLARGHLGRHAEVYENSPGRWEQVVDDAK